jgi:1-acyl-sn-glycerol-3-phosphate acyltransferase
MVSNHQSLADILVIYSLFRHFRWTSKTENFRLPFVGWVLMLNRSIRIYRGEADAWKKFEVQAVKALKDGNSIMIFPEGTRSRTGEPGRFREGAFQLAHNMKTDILPIVLDGTWKAVPKSGWVLTGYQEMVVKVLDPIPFSDFEQMTVPELTHFVHDLILKNLNQLRQLNK